MTDRKSMHPFRLKDYKHFDGRIDFKRLAEATAGWVDPEYRARQTEIVMRAIHRDGKRTARNE